MSDELEKQLNILKVKYVAALPEKIMNISAVWQEISEHKKIDKIKDLYRMTHSLAGSGTTYGQKEISRIAKQFEQFIKDHSSAQEILTGPNSNEIEKYLSALSEVVKRGKEQN